jgi:hypothetical protein
MAGAASWSRARGRKSAVIRSFILVPADGGAVLRHRPGQYLTFTLDVPGMGRLKRNYSISSAPEDRAYRISVKREARPGVPPGLASRWLHSPQRAATPLLSLEISLRVDEPRLLPGQIEPVQQTQACRFCPGPPLSGGLLSSYTA